MLVPHAQRLGLALPFHHPGDTHADHMFYVLLPTAGMRSEVISSMRKQGVNPTFHYVPLHSAPGASVLADRYQDCPVTDDISARLLRLPMFNDIKLEEQEQVVESLCASVKAHSAVAG